MPSGNALELATTIEVIAAYAAPPAVVPAVAASPAWQVVGAFYLPKSCKARLDAIMSVSANDLTMRARLFDLKLNAEVSGSYATTTSQTPGTRALSGMLSLSGNQNYQIQVECFGGTGADEFGAFETATISD